MTRRFRRAPSLQGWVAATLLSLGNAVVPGSALAEPPTLITGDPVPARELAEMLYPMPTRSIVMQQPKATPFGFLIQFEHDSAEIKPESRPYLDEVGKMMNLARLKGKKVGIVGHADASGADAYNQSLSERRAQAVGQYITRYHTVSSEKVVISGRGEAEPLDAADPYDPHNRRVQFHPVN